MSVSIGVSPVKTKSANANKSSIDAFISAALENPVKLPIFFSLENVPKLKLSNILAASFKVNLVLPSNSSSSSKSTRSPYKSSTDV